MDNRTFSIVHTVSSLQVGGMEHLVLRIAGEQQRRGHRVAILALRDGPLAEEARRLGVPVRILNGSGKWSRVIATLVQLARWRPDIVHVHNPTSLQYGVLAKVTSASSVVVTMHGELATMHRIGTRSEWRHVAAAVVVSHAARATLRVPEIQEKLRVIHNGVFPAGDPSARDRVRASLNLGLRFTGIIVARMSGQKGHDVLLKSLDRLRGEEVAVTLLVSGDGAERPKMEAEARRLNLGPEWVQFLGMRSDVPDLLAAADFFVLPSRTEGLPVSVLEAMAHGLPIIVTRVGGLPELIDEGETGLFVGVDDPQQLAAAIARLAGDHALCGRLGERARRAAATRFSFGTMLDRYERLYDEVTPRGRRDRRAFRLRGAL